MKILVIILGVVFLGYWMVQAPEQLAQFTRDGVTLVWDAASNVFASLIDFLDKLFR
jgi:hypothetical protein